MNKLRWFALMLLVTLLLAPYGFTSNADQSFDNAFSIYGNVKVRGTPSGHITVAVDRSFPMNQIPADGVPDVAFHFASRKNTPDNQNIAFDVEGAIVDFTSKRLTVFSTDRHILLNVSVEKEAETAERLPYYEDRSRDLAETVRLNRGKGLMQYQGTAADIESLFLCGTKGGRCAVVDPRN